MTRSLVKTKASKFSLPEPIELAKLAAILTRGWEANPDREVEAALKRALNFYIEAVFLHRELSGKSLDDLIGQGFGIEKRWLARVAEPLERIRRENWADTLELDPQKPSDPAREFLADRGVHLKTGRAVRDIIRNAWDARPAWNAGSRGTFTTDYKERADAFMFPFSVVIAPRSVSVHAHKQHTASVRQLANSQHITLSCSNFSVQKPVRATESVQDGQ